MLSWNLLTILQSDFIYVSGQVPLTAEGTKVEGTIADRAHQCLKNVQAILEEAGSGLDRTVKSKFFFCIEIFVIYLLTYQ